MTNANDSSALCSSKNNLLHNKNINDVVSKLCLSNVTFPAELEPLQYHCIPLQEPAVFQYPQMTWQHAVKMNDYTLKTTKCHDTAGTCARTHKKAVFLLKM